jgi:hypothetical protein
MPNFALPPAAVPAEIARPPFQIVAPSAQPPDGEGWLHEVKHDGHRLLAIVAGDDIKLISRNGHDRTVLFREPFRGLTGPSLVLDAPAWRADYLPRGNRARRHCYQLFGRNYQADATGSSYLQKRRGSCSSPRLLKVRCR